jgi:hypothetical protein
MHHAPSTKLTLPAVAGPVERVVRPHLARLTSGIFFTNRLTNAELLAILKLGEPQVLKNETEADCRGTTYD